MTADILTDVKRASLLLLVALFSACDLPPRRTEPRNANYPVEHRPPEADLRDRDENPNSQAWPLERWLVEFENRNGVELKFRSQDTFGREVVQPSPGPYDSDQDALDALRAVARANGFTLVELRPHIFKLSRLDGIR